MTLILRHFILGGLLSISVLGYGQFNCDDSLKYSNPNKINSVVGFIPSRARVTNGLAINWFFTLSEYCEYRDSIRINGLYTSAGPLQALFVAFIPAFIPRVPSFKNILDADSAYVKPLFKHKLNGMAIGFVEIGEYFSFQGMSVVAIYQESAGLNGLSVSGLAAFHDHFNGIMIAGIKSNTQIGNGLQISLINTATRMNGIQIGLFNNSFSMRGLQIGLWNKIGKRGFPLINFRF